MIQSEKPYVRFGISPAGVWCTDATIAERYGVTPTPVGTDWCVRRYLLRSYGMDTRTLYRLHIAANLLDDRIEQRLHAYRRMVEPNRKAIRLSFLFEPFGIRFELGQNAIRNTEKTTTGTLSFDLNGEKVSSKALSSHRTKNSRRKSNTSSMAQPLRSKAPNWSIKLKVNRTYDETGAPGSGILQHAQGNPYFGNALLVAVGRFTNYPALIPAISWKANLRSGLVSNIAFTNGQLSWTGAEGMRYARISRTGKCGTKTTACRDARYLLGLSYSTELFHTDNLSHGVYIRCFHRRPLRKRVCTLVHGSHGRLQTKP